MCYKASFRSASFRSGNNSWGCRSGAGASVQGDPGAGAPVQGVQKLERQFKGVQEQDAVKTEIDKTHMSIIQINKYCVD